MHEGRGLGSALTVHFGEGETVEADLMLVSVGRAPQVENLGLEELGVELDRRKGIAATSTAAPPSSTSTPSATAPATGSSPTRPSARARSPRRTRWVTRPSSTTATSRPIYTDPETVGVGLTEQEAREQYGDDVEVDVPLGRERPRRDAERDDRLGQVDPREPVRRASGW